MTQTAWTSVDFPISVQGGEAAQPNVREAAQQATASALEVWAAKSSPAVTGPTACHGSDFHGGP